MEAILYSKLYQRYSVTPPRFIEIRLNRELKMLRPADLVNSMLIFVTLANMECPYYLMGESAASFIAYLLGYSSANPLPPHYYCSACHQVERVVGVMDGFDLPEKLCPVCGNPMTGDGHSFRLGYLYGGGLSSLHVCVPDSRYYEIVNHLTHLLGSTVVESEPFFPDKFAQFGAICISSTKDLPAACSGWHNIPAAAQIKNCALSICKNTLPENDCPSNRSVLERCANVNSFSGAVRCYGIASAVWKEPEKSAALLAERNLPDSVIMREDVYDFFRSIGFDKYRAYRQMKRFYSGRGTTFDGMPSEQKAFINRCLEYSYMPSRICAVEYYIARTKLKLNGGKDN